MIIVNHLSVSFGPSILILFTGASHLPASAAEGFFLISGIMVGYVYGAKILLRTKETFLKLWKRAGLLWLLCITFTFFYTAWALAYPESMKYTTLYSRDGVSFIYNTLLLRHSFGWADFLSRYAWFILISPFALWFVAKRMWWLVAGASVAIWVAFRHTEALLPFSAWQLVFIAGLILGYYFPLIQVKVSGLGAQTKQVLSTSFVTVFLITAIFSSVVYVVIPVVSQFIPTVMISPLGELSIHISQYLNKYLNKESLDPLRLIIGSIWFTGLFLLIRKHEAVINRSTKGILEVLGRNSLFVYCFHALLLFTLDMYLVRIDGPLGLVTTTLIAIVILAVIYLVTKYKATIYSYFKGLFKI